MCFKRKQFEKTAVGLIFSRTASVIGLGLALAVRVRAKEVSVEG